jgi:hypothetical protein
MISWSYSRSRGTASIRSGRAGGLAGELLRYLMNQKYLASSLISPRYRAVTLVH